MFALRQCAAIAILAFLDDAFFKLNFFNDNELRPRASITNGALREKKDLFSSQPLTPETQPPSNKKSVILFCSRFFPSQA